MQKICWRSRVNTWNKRVWQNSFLRRTLLHSQLGENDKKEKRKGRESRGSLLLMSEEASWRVDFISGNSVQNVVGGPAESTQRKKKKTEGDCYFGMGFPCPLNMMPIFNNSHLSTRFHCWWQCLRTLNQFQEIVVQSENFTICSETNQRSLCGSMIMGLCLGVIHTGRPLANGNANSLMLLACSVDTPIHTHRFHLLALCVRAQCGLSPRTKLQRGRLSGLKQRNSVGVAPNRAHLFLENLQFGRISLQRQILFLVFFGGLCKLCGGFDKQPIGMLRDHCAV